MKNWKFPSAKGLSINGFNNIGEEFKDDPILALAKEICQNSLDTKFIKEYSNDNKTIKVTFDEFWIDNKRIPGYDDFLKVFEDEYEFNKSFYKNDKEVPDFYKHGIEVLKQEKIRCLRIGDYNTTGLIGSNQMQSSPWCNLTKNAGVSDKPEGSGGSKGMGKFASFICSSLYTVFYSTYAKDELKASCGIARLSGFNLKDGTTALGEGYYEEDGDLFRIPELLNLEFNYPRNEFGTDIYIIGFKEDTNDWKKKIIASVIDNFFLAVYKNELEINICHGEYILNSSNIEQYINDKKVMGYMLQETPYYYNILKNAKNDIITVNYSFFSENDLTLKLRIDDDKEQYNSVNTVAAVRSTGMKILDIKYLPRLGCYHGILEINGSKVNDYFRKLENANHNRWSANRSNNPEEAQNMINKLNNFIKETIKNKLTSTIKDEIDAEGISELLPDDELLDGNGSEKNESIIIDDIISKIEIRDNNINNKNQPNEKSENGEDDVELDENGNIIKEKNPFNKSTNPNPQPNSYSRPMEKYSQVKRKIIPNKLRMKNNQILFSTITDEEIVKIEINISGEGYKEKPIFNKINVSKNNNLNLNCIYEYTNNTIYIKEVSSKDLYLIEYEIENFENWTMEVNVYGKESE